MNPVDEMNTKIGATDLTGAVAGSDHQLDGPDSPEDSRRTSNQWRPVEDLHSLLLRISHHLDHATSERGTTYYRLLAIDDQTKKIVDQTKRRFLRTFAHYLVAICIGVVGTLAWQSYGDTIKGIVATKAPELGWSPGTKQMIASWIEQLGWTKLSPTPEETAVRLPTPEAQTAQAAQAAPGAAAPSAPATLSFDPEQLQQITGSLNTLQQTVGQLAAGQDQMAREITKLQAANSEILQRVPAPVPPPTAAAARKPTPVLPPSRAPILPR
jgi:hypothetical protein